MDRVPPSIKRDKDNNILIRLYLSKSEYVEQTLLYEDARSLFIKGLVDCDWAETYLRGSRLLNRE